MWILGPHKGFWKKPGFKRTMNFRKYVIVIGKTIDVIVLQIWVADLFFNLVLLFDLLKKRIHIFNI